MDKKKQVFEFIVKTIKDIKALDKSQFKTIELNTELDDIGMESIHALQLIEKMKKQYSLENATVSDFYECDTIDDIVQVTLQFSQISR